MKKIKLTKNKETIVDNEDYDYLNQWKWRYHNQGYAVRTQHLSFINGIQKKKEILMHRLISNVPDDKVTDHLNRDKLDNRKSNLIICTQHENRLNSKIGKNNKSGYKGICFDNTRKKWVATGYGKNIGRFKTLKEAIKARKEYVRAN